jgi:hypothetical protein
VVFSLTSVTRPHRSPLIVTTLLATTLPPRYFQKLQLVGIEILVYNSPLVEDWERPASEITRKSLVLLLLLLHLALLAHASLVQSVYTMNSSPVSFVGRPLPGRPTMPPSSDLVRLEHSFTSKDLRFKCCKKTAVQRGSPSWI